jgi:hypothetical protein
MHNFWSLLNIILYVSEVFPSIIRSSKLYTQHQVYVIQVLWLLASGQEMEPVPVSMQSTNVCDIYLMLYVQS